MSFTFRIDELRRIQENYLKSLQIFGKPVAKVVKEEEEVVRDIEIKVVEDDPKNEPRKLIYPNNDGEKISDKAEVSR